ncbi:uncharacterized protein LOC132718014 isoform X2 [Ruditapes philippinarum]|uniref:uncharacterized protein LOC132718014 isoform X2 n=1 Tax=Ruditapes philippinarum TaxID=129788 RepID=UPI00295AD29A|nr:uncharacterized protein LOC132718014 isoform X2 [Ruditapes philippinarum]
MPKRRSKADTSSLADQVSSKRRPCVPKAPGTVQENGTSEGPSHVVSPGSCSSVELESGFPVIQFQAWLVGSSLIKGAFHQLCTRPDGINIGLDSVGGSLTWEFLGGITGRRGTLSTSSS